MGTSTPAPLSMDALRATLTRQPARSLPSAEEGRDAAVAAVFRQGFRGAELLFIRRAVHPRDPWSGQIGFPGGRQDPGDEDLEATATRETREEIGLDLRRENGVELLGALDQIQARARQKILPMIITPFAFCLPKTEGFGFKLNEEVEEAFWVPVHDLANPERRIWYEAERADIPYRFRALDLGRAVPLWGLTHRMTLEILGRLQLIEDVDSLSIPQLKTS
ncbi:MAG: CoA pyrophosphatase [Myxococcota bacterium]|nr:CoA pyrophosphatase [Myxococcota bacterium]